METTEHCQPVMEGDFKDMQKQIDKITDFQNSLMCKFDSISKNVEELNITIGQLREKVGVLEEVAMDRRKLKTEIKVLKKRIEEIYVLVKDDIDAVSVTSDVRDQESCHSEFSSSSKVAMTTDLDRDTVRSAYEDVRSDNSPTEWAVFKFEGARIICSARGAVFSEFQTQFSDDDRAFGYLRMQMGDEMSKRKKFIFVTWVGPNVSVINRAKMSTDKAIIKDIISNFAVELQLESRSEIDMDQFKEALIKAGGANYGTGIRDL